MAYTKQTWADLPSKTTPINANRLTHIEDGIFNAAATADNAASTAGTAAANVGIVSGKVETLTERVNGLDTAVSNKVDKVTGKGLSTNDYDDTDKGKVDSLGTASTKNSTSVVTQSTDLVESGAVYNAVQDVYKVNGVVGAKNRLNHDIQSSDFYIVNSDRSITFTSNPTVDKTINSVLGMFKAGKYKFYCLADGHSDSYFAVLKNTNSSGSNIVVQTNRVVEFTLSSDTVLYFRIFIPANSSISGKTAYPMIWDADDTDTTYQPPAQTNRELTVNKADNSVIGTVEDGTNPTKSYAVGEHMIRGGKFCTVTVPVTTSSTWTLGSNYVEGDVAEMLASPKLLPNNVNLNNYITEGEYFAGAGTYSNCPISDTAFRFKVMPFNAEASRCIQIIYANKTEPEIYMRTNFGGTWQSWYKFTGTVVS